MSASRYYKLNDLEGAPWLVKATSQAQAIRFVAGQTIKCSVASQDDIVAHMKAEKEIHDATTALADA